MARTKFWLRGGIFILAAGFSISARAEDGAPEASPSFALKSKVPECEASLGIFKLPDFLTKGQEFKASLLPLRLAIAELLHKTSPDQAKAESVIADAQNLAILQDILHDRISDELKAKFSEWKHVFESILIQSSMLYRHGRLGLNEHSLSQILEREVPHTVKALLVPSAITPVTTAKPGDRSLFGRWFGFSENSNAVIKKPAALDNYKYLGAPNLYKMLFRFDERLRLDLLKTLIQDPDTAFPEISHLEAYILIAAIPRNSQTAAWDLLLPQVITRAEMFPAKYLSEAATFMEPETFLKSLAANQGQLKIEELLNLLQETRDKTPVRIEEIAKGNNFPTIVHSHALGLISQYAPLDFESAYAIAWAYSVAGKSVEEVSAFLETLEKAATPKLSDEQSQKIRSKIAERVWPLTQGPQSSEKQSLISKIKIAEYLKVGRAFMLSRLYWELQTISSLTPMELATVIEAIPIEAHRSTFDGSVRSGDRPPTHEIIYADNLFSDLALELRFSGTPAVKWYFSDLYWMGITTNLVVMNMALSRASQQSVAPPALELFRNKLGALFANVKPLTPEMIDPQNKWKLKWEAGKNINTYTFNPSEPDELVPGRRGVTLERVQDYFKRALKKLEQRQ